MEKLDDIVKEIERHRDLFIILLDEEVDALAGDDKKRLWADVARRNRLSILCDDPWVGSLEEKRHGANIRGIEQPQPQEPTTGFEAWAVGAVGRKPISHPSLPDGIFKTAEG